MSNRSLERKLKKAEAAYRRHEKRKGVRLVDDILRRDYNHSGAWELLYRLYASGVSYERFRQDFTERYYPEKLHTLQSYQAGEPISDRSEPKTSLLKSLSARFKRKPDVQQFASEQGEGSTPAVQAEKKSTLLAELNSKTGIDTSPRGAAAAESQNASLFTTSFRKEIEGTASIDSTQVVDRAAAADTSHLSTEKVRVLLADDIAQTRETIIRSLSFQQNIEVVGAAVNGLQAIELSRTLKPHVVIMDMNMPGMDGISATAVIKRDMPAIEIVILTVQDDLRYMRQAMLAGARDFLAKPPMIDELIQTILSAGEQARLNLERLPTLGLATPEGEGIRTGKIITVYSPRGGSGSTMLAVNLAFGLHRGDTSVVLVDGDLQFGDVAVHANIQVRNNILDLTPRVDELDPEIVNEVLTKHPSGVKILNPPRLERGRADHG